MNQDNLTITKNITLDILLTGWFFILPTSFLRAGSVSAELDKTKGTTEDQFTLTISVNGKSAEEPKFPAIEGLEVQSLGTQQFISTINGVTTRQLKFSFLITPQREGTFTIPALDVAVDGKKEQSQLLSFEVVKAQAGSGESPVFMKRELSAGEVYLGEQIFSIIKLYTRVNIGSLSVVSNSAPAFQVLPVKGKQAKYQEVINGQSYQVFEINSEILVPHQSGNVALPSFNVRAELILPQSRSGRRGWIDDFFDDSFFGGGRRVQKILKTGDISVKVKELPQQGKQPDFLGLVGTFNMQSNLSPDAINVGESATLTVKLEGQGMLDGMAPLKPKFPEAIKIYQDQPVDSKRVEAGHGVISTKEFKYALVGTKAGEYDLGNFSLSYFDPVTEAYKTLQTHFGKLKVQGSLTQEPTKELPPLEPGQPQKHVKMIGEDLLSHHRGARLYEHHAISSNDLVNIALVITLPLFGLIGSLVVTSLRKTKTDIAKQKRSNAYRSFVTASKKIGPVEPRQDYSDALEKLSMAFKTYLGDKFIVSSSALTAYEIEQLLDQKGIDQELARQSKQILEDCEQFIYADIKMPEQQFSHFKLQLCNVVAEIEKTRALKTKGR